MIEKKQLSEAGAAFVRKALDPFHDFEVRVSGIPDTNTSRTIIQEVTLTQTVTRPATIAAGDTWDLHVVSLPELAYSAGAQLSFAEGEVATAGAQLIQVGPFSYAKVKSGFATFSGLALDPSHTTAAPDFSAYLDGQKRVIAMGFEVHDTTADLYKQGTMTVYRMPQVIETSNMGFYPLGGAGNASDYISTTVSRCPPNLLERAILQTGSRQWEAKKGCYVVSVMDEKDNKLTGNIQAPHVFTVGDLTEAAAYGFGTFPKSTGINYTTSAGSVPYKPKLENSKPIPFHTSGAYLTGLNYESTITIVYRLILEVAPTFDNVQLVVLAQPSPDYDPLALELYKTAAAMLPVGVPVSENASGDFWRKCLNIIATATEKLAPILRGPVLSPSLALGNALAKKLITRSENKRNQVKPQVEPNKERKQIVGNFGANGNKNAVIRRRGELL